MGKLPHYSAKRVRRNRKVLYEVEGHCYPGVTSVLNAQNRQRPEQPYSAGGSEWATKKPAAFPAKRLQRHPPRTVRLLDFH
jgi:hypothetical protein